MILATLALCLLSLQDLLQMWGCLLQHLGPKKAPSNRMMDMLIDECLKEEVVRVVEMAIMLLLTTMFHDRGSVCSS